MIKKAVMSIFLLTTLSACAIKPDTVEPVTGFNPEQYMGTWYEIARLDHSFERGLTNVQATYSLKDNGKVKVLNQGFDRDVCEMNSADGTAKFTQSPDVAQLKVTFFWPFYGGYNVIALDKQDYNWAMIAGPSLDYLWIMSRQKDLPASVMAKLVTQAKQAGFPADDLIIVDHSKPDCLAK